MIKYICKINSKESYMQDRKVEKEEEKMLDIKGTFESFIDIELLKSLGGS